MIYALMQLLGGIILSFGWVPQIIQIVRTKSVQDLNKKTFILLFIGISLMEVYGVHLALDGVGYAFLVTNTLSLCLIMLILSLVWKYR